MRLILVRHGQSPSNLDHLIDTGVPGPPLTELGLRQAQALPAALTGEAIEVVFASSMTRAQMTAAPVAAQRGLEVQVRDGVREVAAGDLEMLNDHVSIELYLRTVFSWAAGSLSLRMPGGEDGVQAFARYDAVVAEAVEATSGTALIVSHGAAIRMWVAGRADNVDAAFAAANPLGNTGVIVLSGTVDGWHVESWTDAEVAVDPLPAADGPGGQSLVTVNLAP